MSISVVIPTYNRGDYLRQAIESVLRQQCTHQVEVIVVDDGSTDDTRARVESFGGRVRYIYTENGGSAHARNVGMRAATGQYLTFLDSDDLHYPYTLEVQSRVLDRYRAVGLVYTEMSGFDDNGYFERYHLLKYHESGYRNGLTYERMFESSQTLGEAGVLPEGAASDDPGVAQRRLYFGAIFDWYLTRLVLFTNSAMIRREVLPAVGERNERVKYWEEMDFTLRITRTQAVCFVDVPAYMLRYHRGQISTTARRDGQYVWVRKQQILLRVVKRQALLDAAYYSRHRPRLDAHLAHLHRAVAVPMLLFAPGTSATRSRYARAARKYLVRCRRLGHGQTWLWLMTFAPGPIRRIGVSLVEIARQRGWVGEFDGNFVERST